MVLPYYSQLNELIPELAKQFPQLQLKSIICKIQAAGIFLNTKHCTLWPNLFLEAANSNVLVVEGKSENLNKCLKQINGNAKFIQLQQTLTLDQSKQILNIKGYPECKIYEMPKNSLSFQMCYIYFPVPIIKMNLEQQFQQYQWPIYSTEIENRSAKELLVPNERKPIMNILYAEGVHFNEDSSQLTHSVYSQGKMITKEIQQLKEEITQNWLVVGQFLIKEQIFGCLMSSIPSKIKKASLRTRESITQKEIEEVTLSMKEEIKELDLPFDGTFWIDKKDVKHVIHPLVEVQLKTYIANQNEIIGEQNRKIEKDFANLRKMNIENDVIDI